MGGPPRHAARHAPRHAAAPPPRSRWAGIGAGFGALAVVAAAVGTWVLVQRDPVVVEAATVTSTSAPVPTVSTTTTGRATSTTTRDPVLGSGHAVTIAFGGDVYFEGPLAGRLADDPASVLAPVAPVLSAADLAVVNMETALGSGGAAEPKEFTFQAPPEALEAFRAAGVDAVSAANNHGMDFGPDGLAETLQAEVDHGFPVIGIGHDEDEAYAPFLAEVRGQRIAVIAASQVLDSELIDRWTAGSTQAGVASAYRVDRLVRAVTEARARADTVVVYLHWGRERETCPTDRQEQLASRLVDAGADVIVGGHAHRVQGGGMLRGAAVHYGLGNFAFGANSEEAANSGVFTVTVTGRRVDSYRWRPARIEASRPLPLTGPAADAALAAWHDLRSCTNLVA